MGEGEGGDGGEGEIQEEGGEGSPGTTGGVKRRDESQKTRFSKTGEVICSVYSVSYVIHRVSGICNT